MNFTASEDFQGKGNVPGYGHCHVLVDTDMSGMMDMSGNADTALDESSPQAGMAMMPMFGMVALPGPDIFELDLSARGPGKHTIWIEPVQSDHTQYEEFWIKFTVAVDLDA
ncbi:hypothetical protein BH23CHL5_BH23CHL5_12060 [soil metagenome]